MRRWIVFTCLLLVLGIITAVGSAWLYAGVHHTAHGVHRLSGYAESRDGLVNGWYVSERIGAGKRLRLIRPWAQVEQMFDDDL